MVPIEPLPSEHGRTLFESARLQLARLRAEGGASLRTVLQEATRLAAETLDVDRVSVWLFVEGRSAIRCFQLYERQRDNHSEGILLSRRDFPAYFDALEQQRVIAAEDARTNEATRDFRTGYLEPLDIRSMLDAPIFQGGQVAGVVCHETVGRTRAWSSEECDFAAAVADAIALQVETAARQDAESALQAHGAYVEEVRRMEALGRLAAGVAHDFRNVLSVVLGHARLLETDPSASPGVVEQSARIVAAADRGIELTRELLSFGRGEPGEKPHAVRIPEVIAKFKDVLAQTSGRSIQVDIEPAAVPGWALISPSRLERVLLNLVSNSRDAMPKGGRITICVTEKKIADGAGPPGAYVVLEVTDTGEGIDEETRRHIFEPFFTTRTADKNSGLGMAVVYRIVEGCGGFMHVESAPGKGTTIAVYLPRVSSQG